MFIPAVRRRFRAGAGTVVLTALSFVTAACQSEPAAPATPPVTADTYATVDGRTISRDDVEKAFRRVRNPADTISEEEATANKLGILGELILQDLLLAKAAALKIEVPTADIDTAFTNAKANIPDDAFQQELSKRGVTVDDMRESLRRELLAQKVIAQEVSAKVAVSDQEIADFFNANRQQFNVPEESYHLAQIVVTAARDPQITNSTGDDATTPEAAKAKLDMLMERLKGGASFRDLAIAFSEDAETAPRGGDLGLVPMTRLRQAPPQLRNAVINREAGTMSVASDRADHTIILVVSHEAAGQRDLSTPAVKDGITDTIRGRKETVLRTAYLTALQSDAKVVNYFARRLVESQGKPPSLAPAAPGAQ
jgi:parvulin-like peptidyl-prolyl isomerase